MPYAKIREKAVISHDLCMAKSVNGATDAICVAAQAVVQ